VSPLRYPMAKEERENRKESERKRKKEEGKKIEKK
jgi:hypothetical protein